MLLAQSGAAASLQSALIAAAVSLVVAVAGWVVGARRDRADRDYQRRRQALLDLQDAALTLRQALRDYGELIRRYPGSRPVELSAAERAFDHARGLLDVTRSRVADPEVQRLVRRWLDAAEVTSISAQDEVPLRAEEQAWRELNQAIGQALLSG